ncbi:DUF624 domain-containing protein [Paenibacillus validus]|uniref:DUF624 domain-containing protein n=1 Tax=Paenibacillus validus TaxID=44253 RepID=A0A7X2ZC56_9BACL|nr:MULTISPECIES: DUF624 domain-containing protein [Paenibacillus]MED4602778.1 DUF624 domain-containing protein [Paenibacillus validus]MED4608366.1 DUF624 domain-containing protein [Paenibacillus validus]MUG71416.1 DUF624 domain-containing protein [Paenibacillus validus]
MEFRGVMGGFYRISEWIMRLSVINLLWIFCAIPFFFLGILLLNSTTEQMVYQTLFLMAVVSPFTLFPSTAAMFSVARKWVTGDEDVPLFKTFFRGYKSNFVQAMIGGFIYLLFGAILYANFQFYGNQSGLFGILRFLVMSISVLLIISLFHFFSILTHLHMKMLQIVKNAVLITIGSPIRSLSMIVLVGVVLFVSTRIFTFLIPFFTGSLIAVISFWHFNLIFGKLQEKQQALSGKEEADEGDAPSDPDEASKSGDLLAADAAKDNANQADKQ